MVGQLVLISSLDWTEYIEKQFTFVVMFDPEKSSAVFCMLLQNEYIWRTIVQLETTNEPEYKTKHMLAGLDLPKCGASLYNF